VRDKLRVFSDELKAGIELRVFSDELKAGIVCSGMNGGSHEATLEMMQLFSEEVIPFFREDAEVDETAGVGR